VTPNAEEPGRRMAQAFRAALRALFDALPIVLGMLLLTSLVTTLVPAEWLQRWLGHGGLADVLAAAAIGSVAAGSPVAGYVLGGELLAKGASLAAVTALLVSWVTVGVAHIPAEALLFGWRFAALRHLMSFVFAIAVAYLAVAILAIVGP